MSSHEAPLVTEPVYGLRTWTVVRDGEVERLAGPHQGGQWRPGGAWTEAGCSQSQAHRPPAPGCNCGVHAWHPSGRSAKHVLSGRRQIPGIAEARGAIEVHEDGIRAERARPRVLVLLPGRNARLVQRLADAYEAEVLEVREAADLLEFCRSHGLGLDEPTVTELLGPAVEESRRARREKRRHDALRVVAAAALVVLLVVGGLALATDPPGERVLKGRAGEVRVNSR